MNQKYMIILWLGQSLSLFVQLNFMECADEPCSTNILVFKILQKQLCCKALQTISQLHEFASFGARLLTQTTTPNYLMIRILSSRHLDSCCVLASHFQKWKRILCHLQELETTGQGGLITNRDHWACRSKQRLNLPCPCLMKGHGKLREEAGKRSRRDLVMREENSKRVLSIWMHSTLEYI